MTYASKLIALTAAASTLGGAAFAAGAGGGQDSNDPWGFQNQQTGSMETPVQDKGYKGGNVLMGKTVIDHSGNVLGVVDSVAPEPNRQERIYVKPVKGQKEFSATVPENYVPMGDTIKIDM